MSRQTIAAIVLCAAILPGACLVDSERLHWVRIADTGEPEPPPAPTVASSVPTSSGSTQSVPAARFVASFDARTFQRGNLHTHSNRSDGDSTPERVAAWYREHGYQFLVLSDHNLRTDPAKLTQEQRSGFILIGGEEVSMRGAGRKVHVNALCTQKRIGGGRFPSPVAAIEWASEKIHAQRGVVLLNHPNYEWALHISEVVVSRGVDLLEIASGHPSVHTQGDATHLSHEALWDKRLETGDHPMGVAVDDMHHIWLNHRTPARPGRAWVEVFATETSESAICEGLRTGRLYASTGAKLSRVRVEGDAYTIELAEGSGSVEFVAKKGAVASRQDIAVGQPATFHATGAEGCVRARVHVDGVGDAWTPAIDVERTPTPNP